MEDLRNEHREWLKANLDKAGRGAKKRLAEFLGVAPDAVTRMLNTDPNKESRDIRAREFERMREFFNDPDTKVDGLSGPVALSTMRVRYGGQVRAGEFLPVDEDFNQDAGDHQVPLGV